MLKTLLSLHQAKVHLGFMEDIMILQNSLDMKGKEHVITLKFMVVPAACRWWGTAVKH